MSSQEFISVLTKDQQKGGLWPIGDKGVGRIEEIFYAVIQGAVSAVLGHIHPSLASNKYAVDKPTLVKVMLIQPAEGGDIISDVCSGGDANRIIATPDGNGLVRAPGTNTTGLGEGSNLAHFFMHLEKMSGLPIEYVTACASNIRGVFKGQVCSFLSVPQPKREGMVKANIPGREEKSDNKRVLLITGVGVPFAAPQSSAPVMTQMAAPVVAQGFVAPAPVAPGLPGLPGLPPLPGAPIASPVASPVAAGGMDDASITSEVEGIIFAALSSAPGGTIAYRDLPGIVKAGVAAGTSAQKAQAMLMKGVNDGFLSTGRPWKYSNKVLSLS